MRGSVLLLVSVIAATSFVALAPSASAAATCTAVQEALGGTPCPDLVCYGYSQGHWQTCVLRDVPIPCQDYPCRDPVDPDMIDLCQYMDNCVILPE